MEAPIGVFAGQSDIGGAVVPGSAVYDAAAKQYTITSAGYNIWYQRDEFRYLWKKMSGDVSLALDARFPDEKGYGDRKVVLVIRQNLEDDSKEAMLGEHGVGMIHLAQRAEKGAQMKDLQYRFGGGLTITLRFEEPFYVGVGSCSHLPDKADSVVVSDLILENAAGKVQ